jgi:protein O-GlcNAc transferase
MGSGSRPNRPHRARVPEARRTRAIAEALGRAVELHRLGRLPKAQRLYREVLQKDPRNFEASRLLGLTMYQQGRHAEGYAMISEALKADPNSAQAHFDQGLVLQALNRSNEALASYTRAIDLNPYFAEAFFNRGNVLRRLGRHEQALDSYTNAIRIRGDYIKALNGQGNALRDLRRSEEALASYGKALAIEPDDVAALTNYGNALRDLNRSGEAFVIYDRALAVSPDDKIALFNRAIGLMTIRYYERAIVDFERLLSIGAAEGHVQGHLLHCRMHCGDWRSYRTDCSLIIENVQANQHCIDPFELLTVCGSEADHLLCSQLYAKKECPPSTSPISRGELYRHERIRVAYLSADFHDHPTAFLAAGLFEHHDRARFETIAVSFGPDQQLGMRARIRDAVDHFRDVREKSDHDVAELLRDLEVDIAVDLKGLTERGRPQILAFRPAPIQVSYLGYPGTMGADYIDYIIADRIVIPESHRQYYTEKVVYLPDSYQVNDSKRQISEGTPSRAEVGLPQAGFVFCSFNNSYKITPTVFDIWMRLLRGVEGSVLWLLESNGGVAHRLRREAAHRGIAPERLVFAPFIGSADHLARCRLADLCLDTLPCNAHTTASDALWAGVPMVTCLGSSFAGRVGASVLNAAGLPELISRSLEDYEQLALRLATDEKALAVIKEGLRINRSACPLFDTDRFRRHIEAAYTTMWERYQAGKVPESFTI